MITLRQLKYLVALAEHRHFGRAAQASAVTQPALSMQIRELEGELGVELVERRPGDVTLTDTGLEVARRAERVLAATRDLADFAAPPQPSADRAAALRRDPIDGALCAAENPAGAPAALSRAGGRTARDPDPGAARRAGARRARRRDAGAAGRGPRDRDAAPVRRSVSARGAVGRPGLGAALCRRRGHRHAAADPAGGGPPPARPGAGVLLERAARRQPSAPPALPPSCRWWRTATA